MTTDKDAIIVAKTKLLSALGEENSNKYLNNMKLWFRQKWSKKEFDVECRKLLTHEQMHLHNKLLIALLNKIDALAPYYQNTTIIENVNHNPSILNSKKRRKTTRPPSEWATFEPADINEFIPLEDFNEILQQNSNQPAQRYAAQELFLPDAGLVMGRLLVGAWEIGLVNVDDTAVDFIVQAVQIFLKNILSSIILRRKSTRFTSDGNYYYDIGHPVKNPFLRTTVAKQKIDDEQIDINKVISSVNTTPRLFEENIFTTDCDQVAHVQRRNITTLDVYKTLLDRNVIPSHSVYTLNIERIANMLN